jgi:4-hydroxy-2-oxoheptanedioate aldolase
LTGIDALFVGPSDLSIALSGGATVNASPRRSTMRCAISWRGRIAAKKPVAFYAASAERAAEGIALGARLVTVMSDSGCCATAAQTALKIASG